MIGTAIGMRPSAIIASIDDGGIEEFLLDAMILAQSAPMLDGSLKSEIEAMYRRYPIGS